MSIAPRVLPAALLALCVAGPAWAQSPEPPAQGSGNPEDQTGLSERITHTPVRRPEPSGAPFIPTEKITADSSVSFPVDI